MRQHFNLQCAHSRLYWLIGKHWKCAALSIDCFYHGSPSPYLQRVKEQHMEGWVNLKLNIAIFLGYTAVYNIYIYILYTFIYISNINISIYLNCDVVSWLHFLLTDTSYQKGCQQLLYSLIKYIMSIYWELIMSIIKSVSLLQADIRTLHWLTPTVARNWVKVRALPRR